MDSDIRELTDLTGILKDHLSHARYDDCADVLEARQAILVRLGRRYSGSSGRPAPEELRAALQSVREQDLEMEEILRRGLKETGREMARAADMKKSALTPRQTSRCLNKRA